MEKILVSGDHKSWDYDEPDTMRKALMRDGVELRDVFEDHAGFDTWATMVRAREIFGVREVLSRLKAVADVTLDSPATDGPKIPIATTDGRKSWGPVPSAGVPPAGSPGR